MSLHVSLKFSANIEIVLMINNVKSSKWDFSLSNVPIKLSRYVPQISFMSKINRNQFLSNTSMLLLILFDFRCLNDTFEGLIYCTYKTDLSMVIKRIFLHTIRVLGVCFLMNASNFDSNSIINIFYYYFADCDVNCHKKCEKLAANLCGVNQKLIVEALATVRRENQGAIIGT